MRDPRPPLGPSTRAIRAAGRTPRVDQAPTSVPIYQTATFATVDADELGAISGGAPGYSYSRIGNPTTTALGDAVAELHGAEAGLALASGMAAIHAGLLSLLRAGDGLLVGTSGYGTTRTQALSAFERFGVQVRFVDLADLAAVEAALATGSVRVIHAETITNPTCTLVDLPAIAALAHRRDALVTVDNTFASPVVCRPLEHGADLVMESATKYLSGHSDVIAGAVVGSAARVAAVRAAQVDTGSTLGPFGAFLVLRGIATLPVRMERQARTAAALAAWLERQDGVASVTYPGLASHPQRRLAERLLEGGGAMLAVELAGGRAAGRACIDTLEIAERTASLGSVHTMVVHPPSTSHRSLDDDALRLAGITPGLLRVSVGLEDEADLIADLARGLAAALAVGAPDGPTAGAAAGATTGG